MTTIARQFLADAREARRPSDDVVITRLLVATDATPESEAALRAARAIARHCDAGVEMLAVHQPLPMVTPEVQLPASPGMDAQGRDALRLQVLAQCDRIGIDEDWPLSVVSGDPAAVIARVAEESDATLIVMGIGQHGVFDRLFGDETVLKVLRLTSVPVLAVAPGFSELPFDVIAALDFTKSSVRAAALAAALMQRTGRLSLVHVLDPRGDAAAYVGSHTPYEGAVGRAFDVAIARLPEARPETVTREVLAGAPAQTVLQAAERRDADLVVAGSHGHGFLTRLVIGSVSQKLVRSARCSVLIAPPEGGNYLDEVPALSTRFAAYEWAERLEEFTRRNAGRSTTLEVIDPDVGAQIEERGFPFAGSSFDPRTGQVQIMLGDAGHGSRHLTRSIGNVTAVQVLRDRAGRDLLLRVAHGRGQTLLTLER